MSTTSVVDNEKKLIEIWRHVLGVDKVGINDNFFDLGGNSLLAVRIVIDIKKSLTADISVTQLFQYPTVSSLAADLTKSPDDPPITSTIEERAKMRRGAIKRRRRHAADK